MTKNYLHSRYYREGVRLATQARVDAADDTLEIHDAPVGFDYLPPMLVAKCPGCQRDIVFMKNATELKCQHCGWGGHATIKRRER